MNDNRIGWSGGKDSTASLAISIHSLGRLALERRGVRGIREVAVEMGISPATLSRVERGKMPDLETFGKICKWLRIYPAPVFGISSGGLAENQPERKARKREKRREKARKTKSRGGRS